MAQRQRINGQNKKMYNNFLDSIEVSSGFHQGTLKMGRSQKRKAQGVNLSKQEMDLSKSSQMNPFRMPDEQQRGRNLVNKSLCYDPHNNSLQTNNQGPWVNQSLDYASNISLNGNSSCIYMSNQAAAMKYMKEQQLEQQRNTVLNLAQMRGSSLQHQPTSSLTQTLQNGVKPSQIAQSYNFEYLNSSKANHSSKKSSISKPKDSTKRSGTGGTSNNQPQPLQMAQNKQALLMRSLQAQTSNNNTIQITKQSKAKVPSRQIMHNGVSLRRMEKMRASSQLGYSNQTGMLLEFEQAQTRQGAQSNLGQPQQILPQSLQLKDQAKDQAKDSSKVPYDVSTLNQTMTLTAENVQSASRNSSFKNISNQINNQVVLSDFITNGKAQLSNSKAPPKFSAKPQSETIALELEQKLRAQEKDFDKIKDSSEKTASQLQMYLKMLEEIGSKDRSYQQLLGVVKRGLDQSIKKSVSDQQQLERSKVAEGNAGEVKQKQDNYERVIKEMKKQLTCYKNEISGIKKMESYLTLENYQKLINEFNQLYDHYKGLKSVNKKLKVELKQSNQRERTFLKLLKKTKEFGEQATRLELEYDKLFNCEHKADGLEVYMEDSDSRTQQTIEKGGIRIPKLDLSSIYMQREAVSSQNEEESEEENESYYNEENSQNQDSQVDSKAKKAKFEQQKKAFKEKMLNLK